MRWPIVLVGMRAAGKTTLGSNLARRIGVPFLDLDVEVARRARSSIADLFARRGEPAFRALESRALADIEPGRRCVVATGGGVVERRENRDRLRRLGTVVWLQANSGVLADRLEGSSRPSLTGRTPAAELSVLLRRRGGLYRAVAGVVLRAGDADPSTLADRLARRLGIAPVEQVERVERVERVRRIGRVEKTRPNRAVRRAVRAR